MYGVSYYEGVGRDGGGDAAWTFNRRHEPTGRTTDAEATEGVRGGGGGAGVYNYIQLNAADARSRTYIGWNGARGGDGSVIIRYATPVTTPPTSYDELDKLIKEYEQKMAELGAVLQQEKQALIEGNAAAAQQAQAIQQKLVGELTALKQSYDQLTVEATQTQTTLQQTQQQLADTKTTYDQKMQEFNAARQKELDAINAKNAEAVAAAKAEQTKLIGEMTSLKATYDALVTKLARCPVIPENTVLVDGGSAEIYRFEGGALRPMSMETYRALGSPPYTTFPQGSLTNCPAGQPLVVQVTTMAPAPRPPAPVPRFDGTLFVLVHAPTWQRDGQLRVLSSRFGGLAIEPFENQSVDQAFLVNDGGYIRSLTGKGPYVSVSPDCMVPTLDQDPPKSGWRITRTGQSPLGYRLVAPCGSRLVSSGRDVGLDRSQGDAEDWFVVKVGRAQVPQ